MAWKKITSNRDSWPPSGKDVLVCYWYEGGDKFFDIVTRLSGYETPDDDFPAIKGHCSGSGRVYYWTALEFLPSDAKK